MYALSQPLALDPQSWFCCYPMVTLSRIPSHSVNVPTVPQGPSRGPGPIFPSMLQPPLCNSLQQSGSHFHLFSEMALSKATRDVNCKSKTMSQRHFAFALCEASTPLFWKLPAALTSMSSYPSEASLQMSAVFFLQTQPLTIGVSPNGINGT